MSAPYKVSIVGYGYVGQAVYRLFEDWEPEVYDPKFNEEYDASSAPKNIVPSLKCLLDSDLIVICVPTNKKKSGCCDLSIVKDTVVQLGRFGYKGIALVKSATVPWGFLNVVNTLGAINIEMDLVVSPEYIGEGGYFVPYWKYPHPTDMSMHSFQIFGGNGNGKDTSRCVDIFIRKTGPECQFFQTNYMTACLTKYMENCWHAMKVSFANQFYDIAKKYHYIDYNELRELWCADTRVGKSHTAVFPESRGYGGKCLSKDPVALIRELQEQFDYTPPLLQAMEDYNNELRAEKGSGSNG